MRYLLTIAVFVFFLPLYSQNVQNRIVYRTDTSRIKAQLDTLLTLSPFDKGFRDGYIDQWCQGVINCIEPIPPNPPIPEFGFETYKDGYLIGAGKAKKQKRD